ncbi:NYN domain-containing protein [Candidatus Berkelbacteria bacterium]|nr:NYN domain-containing protein [Candidatus Berkelbacteria bacterium]
MNQQSINNYAFIDAQNLNLGIRELGWSLDFKRFRIYLKEKYHITKAYLFIGYVPENTSLYKSLQEFGYTLMFKPILKNKDGIIKGNIDADLVLQAMIDFPNYNKAVIATSDGDFYSLVQYLYKEKKLALVLSPNRAKCSILLKKSAQEKIDFLDNLRKKLAHKKKRHR